MVIDGVKIITDLPDLSEVEARRYVDYVRERVAAQILALKITGCDDGKVDVTYEAHGAPFHRLRRITGYLTSDLRSWNDAKQAEERERVKHEVSDYG